MDSFRDKRRQDELLRVAEQAAEWLITLEDDRPEERTAFAAWLEESPLHVEMFLRASAVNQMNELVAPEDRRRLVNSAETATGSNVIAMESAPSSRPAAAAIPAGIRRRAHWLGGSAAAIAAVAVTGWLFVYGPYSWDRYATAVGEQRTVALDDGSVIYVNTRTRVDVRYTKQAREVRLMGGEALFNVEHDPARPFRVHVGAAVVQAVGTQFNIYRRANGARVAVIEGIVQVSPDRTPAQSAATSRPASTGASRETHDAPGMKPAPAAGRLAAGQALNLGADGRIEPPVAVNVAQVTAWRQRRLVFEWETLGTIADEFNRYNRSPQIRVEGDAVRARRYTMVFDADNPQTLLKFLATEPELTFAADGGDFVIRSR